MSLRVNQLAGFGARRVAGGAGPLEVTKVNDDVFNGETGSTHTYTSISFGDAHADRYLIAVVWGADNPGNFTATSITIGGVSATLVQGNYTGSGNVRNVVIACALVPTGTSGDVVINWSESVSTGGRFVCMLRVVGLASATPVDSDSDTSGSATGGSCSIDIPAGGLGVGGFVSGYDAGAVAWTGIDEIIEASTGSFSSGAAAEVFATAQTALAVTATTGGNDIVSMAVASYAKAA